jgi:hypothetical protein
MLLLLLLCVFDNLLCLDPVTGVDVADRVYRLKKYKRCFVASQLVDWLALYEKVINISSLLLLLLFVLNRCVGMSRK